MIQAKREEKVPGTAPRLRGPALASLAAALLALALPAVMWGQAGQGTSLPAPQFNPAVAGGPAPDLDLLFTAQVAGWIEPCG
ncbi:MAG TPA: hypothetical protein VFQ07_04045 [Candidatus Polarisedimenticolia bacterium]|nr:hypothetical protein [Candidatus Polarisedimenticolia bacterium]